MPFHYSEQLTGRRIADISERWGFSHLQSVEKFIMCFEIHHRMAEEAHCVVRGGMCMPFHHPHFAVRRMSKDIDIFSSNSVGQMDKIMEGIAEGLDGFWCRKVNPANPLPIENLASYKIRYHSCFGKTESVKVDVFCGVDVNLDTQSVRAGSQVLGFEILRDMTILSKGSLAADKITSLALGTIGVDAKRHAEITKQIHDIAALLRSADKNALQIAYDSYPILTKFKARCFLRKPPFRVSDIISDTAQSLTGLVPRDTDTLISPALLRTHDGFRGDYLSSLHSYNKSDHIVDTLLVLLFALSVGRCATGLAPPQETDGASYLYSVLEGADRVRSAGVAEAHVLREVYLNEIPTGFIKKRMLASVPPERVYLLKEVALALL